MFILKRLGWILGILFAFAVGTFGTRWALDLLGQSKPAVVELDPTAPGDSKLAVFSTDSIIRNLQSYLQSHSKDSTALGNLGIYYLQKARESGDPAFYPKAEGVLNQALELDPQNFRALLGMGSLALARHQFHAALDWGRRAQKINPDNTSVYGIIGDAQIETGDYSAAFETIQHMVDLRPDLASYARMSYARELTGDLPGAIRAMQQAIEAGAPSSEGVNWARVQLGNLYLAQANYADAESAYQTALNFLPDYPYALAGIANVRAAQGNYDAAISIYTRVVKTMPLPQFVIALGDIDATTGRSNEAAQQYDLVEVEEKLYAANGVDIDAEMALFDADHARSLPQALERARGAYARRPSITVADVLAWTLYQSGDYAEAQEMMNRVPSLGTRNALMDYHAGMIAYKTDDLQAATDYLEKALSLDPRFSLLYADQAKQVLSELRSRNLATGASH